MKLIKILSLIVVVPIAFIALGLIGAWTTIVLMFNEEKRNAFIHG